MGKSHSFSSDKVGRSGIKIDQCIKPIRYMLNLFKKGWLFKVKALLV